MTAPGRAPWLGAALALLIGCSPAPLPPRPDIVLVTIDTLRPDHLGLYAATRPTSPRIDEAFSEGLVFERAYSTNASTPQSIMSLLTGRPPWEHRVRLFFQLAPPEIPILPELLPDEYESAAFVSSIVLSNEALGLASRFDHYDDFVDERESIRIMYERRAERTIDAVLAWLESGRDPARPLFLWVHLIDPHGPYDPPASWTRSFRHEGSVPVEEDKIEDYVRIEGATDALDYVDLYDEEIAYTDSQVGRLLEGHARVSPPAEPVVILTADHGESMMDHERWFEHGYQVYEELVRVPLAIRGPGIAAARRAGPAWGPDLVPTVLGLLGEPLPPGLTGHDLVSGGAIDPGRAVVVEGMTRRWQWRAALRGDAKWVARGRRGKRGLSARRFYDLARDPRELDPQPWPEPGSGDGASVLRELTRSDPDPGGLPKEFQAGLNPKAPKVAPGVEAEDLERLRALGYVD